jgi:hypothetical protein
VFLGDACLASFPSLAQFGEVRQEDVAQHGLKREAREQPVDGCMCAGLVEPVERFPEVCGQRHDARGLAYVAGFAGRLRKRQSRGLRGGDTCIQVAAHRPNAALVGSGVEAKAAG